MFERFTNKARQAVVGAQEQARALDHNFIGTEHLLLGLLAVGDSVAVQALTAVDVDIEALRAKVIAGAGRGNADRAQSGHIPFTRRAKKVMELSLREALALETSYIGTEHLLLALVREGEGAAAKVLAEFADGLAIRSEVIKLLPTESENRGGSRRRRIRTFLTDNDPARAEPDGDRTAAVDQSLQTARELAGEGPVGSQHVLLGMLESGDSAATKALAGMGVDIDALREQLKTVDVSGTSDAAPEVSGGRSISINLEVDGVRRLVLSSDDHELVDRLVDAATSLGKDLKDARISGVEPLTESFAAIWESVRDGLAEIKRKAETAT